MKTLNIEKTGYGHWKVSLTHYGKVMSSTTTNSEAIDDYNCEEEEKDGRELRKKRGYISLRNEVIRKNKFN